MQKLEQSLLIPVKILESTPTQVVKMLGEVFDIFSAEETISTIVTGSTARGELSFYEDKNGLALRSDIELYVVCEKPTKLRKKVAEQLNKLEMKYSSIWPEFHIDIAYMTLRRFMARYIRF